ncbi:ABC-2 type transport system ATP-binding protein [Tissierella praeacuta DSM 18095]|uniref:ABC-2 type transport system ATP-binding protein n=1 Tax=Tissierella praeacuta DSM 18095 TaxID=1123404 RepID=A0A1M4UBD6_9FIRM|nr:ABC transporter ATP-binding protein [Tissierella praeacuta]SHE53994.1 ABC-2 type transport system ATP-binding protein [Tissierella praeacuta DSM 18095]SUP04041.1 Methionine import ATP-binding protein MetN 2 [Tissierella praeacuta]
MNIVQIKNCSKKYNKNEFFSIENIDLKIGKGEIVGLIGPNGAGKTTLIKTLSGLLKPTEYEEFKILGDDIYKGKMKVPKVGLVLNSNQMYDGLTVMENIQFFLKMHKIKKNKEEIMSLLKRFNLQGRESSLVNSLSTGMKQKLNIIRIVLLEVQFLILDEPTSGLDPVSKSDVHNLLYTLSKEMNITILISSHIMNEVQRLCTRVVFLNKGQIIKDNNMDDIFKEFHKDVIELRISKDETKEMDKRLRDYGIKKYIIWSQNDNSTALIMEKIARKETFISKLQISSFNERPVQLEDVFFYELYKDRLEGN